jgi:hypothetical protein
MLSLLAVSCIASHLLHHTGHIRISSPDNNRMAQGKLSRSSGCSVLLCHHSEQLDWRDWTGNSGFITFNPNNQVLLLASASYFCDFAK